MRNFLARGKSSFDYDSLFVDIDQFLLGFVVSKQHLGDIAVLIYRCLEDLTATPDVIFITNVHIYSLFVLWYPAFLLELSKVL